MLQVWLGLECFGGSWEREHPDWVLDIVDLNVCARVMLAAGEGEDVKCR